VSPLNLMKFDPENLYVHYHVYVSFTSVHLKGLNGFIFLSPLTHFDEIDYMTISLYILCEYNPL
jgi:hypothetical protein